MPRDNTNQDSSETNRADRYNGPVSIVRAVASPSGRRNPDQFSGSIVVRASTIGDVEVSVPTPVPVGLLSGAAMRIRTSSSGALLSCAPSMGDDADGLFRVLRRIGVGVRSDIHFPNPDCVDADLESCLRLIGEDRPLGDIVVPGMTPEFARYLWESRQNGVAIARVLEPDLFGEMLTGRPVDDRPVRDAERLFREAFPGDVRQRVFERYTLVSEGVSGPDGFSLRYPDKALLSDVLNEAPHALLDIKGIRLVALREICEFVGSTAVEPEELTAAIRAREVVERRTDKDGTAGVSADDMYMSTGERAADGRSIYIRGTSRGVEDAVGLGWLRVQQGADLELAALPESDFHEKRFVESICALARQPRSERKPGPDDFELPGTSEEEAWSKLSPEQRSAFQMALREPISGIEGHPGVGKSYSLARAIEIASAQGDHVVVVTPTGAQADRVNDYVGMTIARTAHSIEGVMAGDRFTRDPIPEPHIDGRRRHYFIDEAGMQDLASASAITARAAAEGARLTFIMDPHQLLPIGYGTPWHDLVASGVVPVAKLTEPRRSPDKELLLDWAYAPAEGRMPYCPPDGEMEGGVAYIQSSAAEIPAVLEALYRKQDGFLQTELDTLAADGEIKNPLLSSVRLVVPHRQGMVGADYYSTLIQAHVHGHKPKDRFAVGDPVRATASISATDLETDVRVPIFNSANGIVEAPGRVRFPRLGLFDVEEIRESLGLRYAGSCHSLQGDQADVVVMVVLPEHRRMMSREWVRTAASRAKKLMIFVGDADVIAEGITRSEHAGRQSLLTERLQVALSGLGPHAPIYDAPRMASLVSVEEAARERFRTRGAAGARV